MIVLTCFIYSRREVWTQARPELWADQAALRRRLRPCMACVVGAFSLADFWAAAVSLAFLPSAGLAAAAAALVARPFAAGLAACRVGCLAAGFLAAARAGALFDLAGCLLGFLKSSSESSDATSDASTPSDSSSLPSSSAGSRVVRHETQHPFRELPLVAEEHAI